ncbi:Cyclophilin-like domain [Trinorchestia longiramus]|nr:Cyclophilin-like domain [Trinorchestia longiramus]
MLNELFSEKCFSYLSGPCKELHNKHTIFGKVAGDTLYNLPRFEEGDIGKNDRPTYPHSITKTEVLVNPFPDIVPRKTISNEIPREDRKKKKKGVKNFSLLSFGGEAEEDEAEVISATKAAGGSGGPEPSLMEPRGRSTKDDASAKERIREKLRKVSEADAKSRTARLAELEKKKKGSSSEESETDEEQSHIGKENQKKIANTDRKRDRSEEKSVEKMDEQKRKKKREEIPHEESSKYKKEYTKDTELSQEKNKSSKSTKSNDHDKGKEEKFHALADKRKKDPKSCEKETSNPQDVSVQLENGGSKELAGVPDPEKTKSLSAIRAEIKQLKRELTGKNKKDSEKETPDPDKDEGDTDVNPSAVREYLNEKQKFLEQKKKSVPKDKHKREDLTLAMVKKFSMKVKSVLNDDDKGEAERVQEDDDNDDDDWLRQKVLFSENDPVLAKDANTKDDSWYALDDPRHPLNKRKRGENVPSSK